MSKYPINYTFVHPETVTILGADGEAKSTDVLVLDSEQNTAYWKKIYSFHDTITKSTADGQTPVRWHLSPNFVDLAVKDILDDDMTILGLPVTPTEETTEPTCMLEFTHSSFLHNETWK